MLVLLDWFCWHVLQLLPIRLLKHQHKLDWKLDLQTPICWSKLTEVYVCWFLNWIHKPKYMTPFFIMKPSFILHMMQYDAIRSVIFFPIIPFYISNKKTVDMWLCLCFSAQVGQLGNLLGKFKSFDKESLLS